MHSIHPSRGRILFEALCALVISASFIGAWMQTGATALLPAAGAAALYGLVHLFDMRRPKSAVAPKSAEAVEPQRIDFETDQRGKLLADLDAVAPLADVDQAPVTEHVVKDAEPVEPAPAQPKAARKAKAPRKSGGRRVSAPKAVSVAELAPRETEDVAELALPATADVAAISPPEEAAELLLPEEAEFAEFAAPEETAHPHIAPLFEPEPFARMPRRAFGRRGRI